VSARTGEVNSDSEFSYPWPNLIVSRDGFSVEVEGRNGFRYQEADKAMEIFVEPLVGAEPTMALRRSDLRGWLGDEGRLSEPDRVRIVGDIESAFAFKGWPLVIEG
jgi:hypothetical protein